jgi:hypothetical protein
MPTAKQQLPNMQQQSYWEVTFSAQSVLPAVQLCDAAIEELLGEVFSV